MNYRSIFIVCLATLGLAVAGWGQVVTSRGGEDWVVGAIRRLTDASGDDWFPSWSPNGRHIAFVSNRDGDWEIYVMDIASYTGGEPTAAAETSWGQIKSLLSMGTH